MFWLNETILQFSAPNLSRFLPCPPPCSQDVTPGLPSTTVQIAAQVMLTTATDTPQTALSLLPPQFTFGTPTLNFTAVVGTNQPVRGG